MRGSGVWTLGYCKLYCFGLCWSFYSHLCFVNAKLCITFWPLSPLRVSCMAMRACVCVAWHTVTSDQSPLAFLVFWLYWWILLHRPSGPGVYHGAFMSVCLHVKNSPKLPVRIDRYYCFTVWIGSVLMVSHCPTSKRKRSLQHSSWKKQIQPKFVIVI